MIDKSDYAKAFERMSEDSGQGSSLEFTAPYREFLSWFIIEHQIARTVDLGCGDMRTWENVRAYSPAVPMSGIEGTGTGYFGIDIFPERIDANRKIAPSGTYKCANILECGPFYAGLIHCKDVLQHWPLADIHKFLEILRQSYFRFALITNCNYDHPEYAANSDIKLGDWRPLDLTARPFSVGRKVFSWGDPNKDVVLIEP